jgi:hypothetical protein
LTRMVISRYNQNFFLIDKCSLNEAVPIIISTVLYQ